MWTDIRIYLGKWDAMPLAMALQVKHLHPAAMIPPASYLLSSGEVCGGISREPALVSWLFTGLQTKLNFAEYFILNPNAEG